MKTWIIVAMAAAALGAAPAGAQARPQALKRTILQTFDVPAGSYQTMIGISEIGPDDNGGRQSHPGPEAGYVLAGSGTIVIEGRPPLKLAAGQSYKLAAGIVHEVRGGPKGVKLLVTWVVQKGQPLDAPVR